jgi:hypothetical protein
MMDGPFVGGTKTGEGLRQSLRGGHIAQFKGMQHKEPFQAVKVYTRFGLHSHWNAAIMLRKFLVNH